MQFPSSSPCKWITVAKPPSKFRKQTQECLKRCIRRARIEEFGLARIQKQAVCCSKLDKRGLAYIWLPPTLNDRPGLVVITTSWAETLLASSDGEGKCINKHLFACFNRYSSNLYLALDDMHSQKISSINVPSMDLNMAETLVTLLRPSWGQRQGGFFGESRPKHQLCSKPSLPKPRIIFLSRAQL